MLQDPGTKQLCEWSNGLNGPLWLPAQDGLQLQVPSSADATNS